MITKSKLAIELSMLMDFAKPKLKTEQYTTNSEVAAEILWNAYMGKDIEGKTVADLGCGTGILGIGSLLLGAKRAYFVDSDSDALAIAEKNLNKLDLKDYELIESDINAINVKADVVIQNPPFGTKTKHADRPFLIKAFSTANVIYSIHKATSINFVEKLSKDNKFKITHLFRYSLPIPNQHAFHKKRLHRIETVCFRLQRVIS